MDTMPLELRKLGLNEKEAKVYLAGLELGPSSVQEIAKVAKITRPTAYEIIRNLEKKGLVTEAKEKKRMRFTAQPPGRILGILRTQKREIEEKEREFIRIIATLEARYLKEEVQAFKGREGLKSLVEILSFSSVPEIFIINSKFNPIWVRERKKILQAIRKRLGKVEVKEISAKLKGSLIIFDKIIFFPSGKQVGFLLS